MQKADIENKLELCIESFKSVLYERDETFLENMAKSNMDQAIWPAICCGSGPRAWACTACGSCSSARKTGGIWRRCGNITTRASQTPARQKHQHHGARPGVVLFI